MRKDTLAKCLTTRNEIIGAGAKNTSSSHEVASCVMMSGTKVIKKYFK